MRHLRAALVLAVYVAMGVLATPGLDYVGEAPSPGEPPPPFPGVTAALRAFNHAVRGPVARALHPLEVPLRLEEDWSLFATGPEQHEELVIRVDGKEVDRSTEGLAALRDRRVRPLVDGWIDDHAAPTDDAFLRWLCDDLHARHPDAARVDLEARWSDLGGGPARTVRTATCTWGPPGAGP